MSVRGRRSGAGVKQGQEWLFVSMKMKGPSLATEPPQSQHFPGLLPKSLSEGRSTNEAALGGEPQLPCVSIPPELLNQGIKGEKKMKSEAVLIIEES